MLDTPEIGKNGIVNSVFSYAEVGDSPRLKILPLIFKRPSADAVV